MKIKDLLPESQLKLRPLVEYWNLEDITDEFFSELDLNKPVVKQATAIPYLIPNTDRFLHFAVLTADEALVKDLVDNDVDVNQVDDRSGKSPLQCAADNGRSGIAKMLIEKGARTVGVACNYTSNPFSQPLTFAWSMKEQAFGRQVNYNEMKALIEQNNQNNTRKKMQ
jgi:ankyrin repeat protein